MEAIYDYVHIIHLVLAIIFLGYVFTDLAIISALKGKFEKDIQQKIVQLLGQRSFKIFPITLLSLILTGGIMMSKYINFEAGMLNTPLQQVLMLKIFLVLIIAMGVGYNLYKKLTKGTKNNFMQNHFHKLVIVLGIFIVISAKLMFII